MAINANFYSFSKRKNSTKQPTGTPTTFQVKLKGGTSFISPTLILNNSGYPNFNYLEFNGAYYFVKDIISTNNDLWEIVCEIDALATIKSQILATTAYVLYDSDSNTEIPDNRIPMKTTASVSANTVTCPFVPDSGCYILALTGGHDTTGIYKTDSAGLASLIDDLQDVTDNIFEFSQITPPQWPSSPSGNTIPEWLDFVGQCLGWVGDWIHYLIDVSVRPLSQIFGSGNIPQNIRECRFIPFNVGVTYSPQTIYLGTFETQTALAKLNSKTVHRTTSINIPWPAADFRRRSPYTQIYLYLPYIGMIKLSSENLIGISTLDIAYTLGLLDGSFICTVKAGSEVLGQYTANVASSVPIGVSNINIPRAGASLISGVASALEGNIATTGFAAINFAENMTPNFSSIGGLDGVATVATDQNIRCYVVYHDTVVAPNTNLQEIGSPTMSPKALSGLTGFCQCMNAHVEAAYPSIVLAMADNYLNSGFFIE